MGCCKDSKRCKGEYWGFNVSANCNERIPFEGEYMGIGVDYEELRDGVGNYSYAIIKLDSGQVVKADIESLWFI